MRSLAAALFLVLVANSFMRSAEAADPYTVSGIVVDLTRETSAIARKEAIEIAHVQAFERLFKRLSVSNKSADFPEINYLIAADHTAGFKIDDEVTSETRYAAKITISFVPERVSNFFQEYRIQFTDKQAPSVIVVPVLAWAGALSLWQQNNPWRTAWTFLDTYDGLTPVMNPTFFHSSTALSISFSDKPCFIKCHLYANPDLFINLLTGSVTCAPSFNHSRILSSFKT